METMNQDPGAKAKLVDTLYQQLFGDPELKTYAVLDGAPIPDLLEHLEADAPDHFCLYRGELSDELAEAAPYLVQLQPNTPFTDWLLSEGWGNHWGIFALSTADIREMRKHFRTFLIVKDPKGKQIYFRYYDPRVMRVYFPTCKPKEIAAICGPVATYFMEAESPGSAILAQNNGKPMQTIILEEKR